VRLIYYIADFFSSGIRTLQRKSLSVVAMVRRQAHLLFFVFTQCSCWVHMFKLSVRSDSATNLGEPARKEKKKTRTLWLWLTLGTTQM
jgi:hypothetical protein